MPRNIANISKSLEEFDGTFDTACQVPRLYEEAQSVDEHVYRR